VRINFKTDAAGRAMTPYIAKFIIDPLYEQNKACLQNENAEEVLIEFSVYGLKTAYEKN
jgi:hypothetical protein